MIEKNSKSITMSIRNPFIGGLVIIFGAFILIMGIYGFIFDNSIFSLKIYYIITMPIIGAATILLGYIYYGDRKIIINKNKIRLVWNIGQMAHTDLKTIKLISNGKSYIEGNHIKIQKKDKTWFSYSSGHNITLKKELMYVFNEIIKNQHKYKFEVNDKEGWGNK